MASIYQLFKENEKLKQMQEKDMKEPTEKFLGFDFGKFILPIVDLGGRIR